ncbi:MAG: hypothetical protein Q7S87_03515 [Agitococcus sp.]|nr:hypothetical protein [Agitococcus sp.]MDO9177651.1 hypothetical protein [Agitococcus sp.]
MTQQKAGHLDVGVTRLNTGKVIDEWSFASPFKRGAKVPQGLMVKISLHKSEKEGILFCAKGPCLTSPIEDTDIARLRSKVDAALRLQHKILTGVTWEPWLEVRVTGKTQAMHDDGAQSDLSVRYSPLQRGVDSVSHEVYYLTLNGVAAPFPLPKKAGEPDTASPGDSWMLGMREVDTEYSYVPATAANIAALDSLMARMDDLRATLAKLLSHDAVQNSLDNGGASVLCLPE